MVCFQMKDYVWRILPILASASLVLTIDDSSWAPSCSTSSKRALSFVPHPVDCRKYFACIQGIAYPISCPFGLNWDPSSSRCSTLSSCENNKSNKPPTYNPLCPNCKSLQKAISNGQVNPACPFSDDSNHPIHLPHPGDCTKFLKCSFGRSFIVACPYGLHWNVGTNRCDSPFVAQCGETAGTIVSPTTQQTSIVNPSPTGPSSNANIPVCPENGVKNFGIPGQCDQYFSCSQGKLYVMNCRTGRQWSEKVKGCIDSSLAGCTGLTSGTLSTRTTQGTLYTLASSKITQRPQDATGPISCTPGLGLLPHPTDCQKYIVCDNGKPVEMSCPKGLFFRRASSSCQWTSNDC